MTHEPERLIMKLDNYLKKNTGLKHMLLDYGLNSFDHISDILINENILATQNHVPRAHILICVMVILFSSYHE